MGSVEADFCCMAEQRIDKANEAVRDWGKIVLRKLKRQVTGLTLKTRRAIHKRAVLIRKNPNFKPIEKSLGLSLKKEFGGVSRINFKFQRHGIFFEHGVGRGRPVRSSRATPRPWLAPILDPAIQELADIIASEYADLGVDAIKITIPGIINRRIKVNNG